MLGIASMALGSISGLNQLLTARSQKRMADRIQAIRPTYQVSNELLENANTARQAANANMAGYGTALNNLQAGTAQAARAAQLAGGGQNALAAIAAANQNQANASNDLATQNAQHRVQMMGNLQNQLGTLADERRKSWQYNQADRYTENSAAKAALTNASQSNKHNAISSLSNLGIVGLQGLQNKKTQEKNHTNNLASWHRSELDNMRNTPLFGGLQPRFGL